MTSRPSLSLVLLLCLSGCLAGGPDERATGRATGPLPTSKEELFADQDIWFVRVDGWDPARMEPAALRDEQSVEGAELRVYRMSPGSTAHCPDAEVDEGDLVLRTRDFTIRTSGNFTNGTPKSSFKIKLRNKDERLFGMRALNLKSMWNDVSQMREALAWRLFGLAGVRAPLHTYARLCMNDRYRGLYSMIENVDEAFLRDWFGKHNDDGNLYKAYWEDIGPANLVYRGDAGSAYFASDDIEHRTYQLKTNDGADDDPALQTYDDLATFIGVLNGVDLPVQDGTRFDTPEYEESLERVFDVHGFLRWASVNLLLGAWDNYWGTPANYYLYDAGHRDAEGAFMDDPYFTWIPWDYDNSLGIDFFAVDWQYADIVDWEAATAGYYDDGTRAQLRAVKNLLRNHHYLRYYLDHMQWMLEQYFNDGWVVAQIGQEGSGGLWDRVRASARLESDGERDGAHTGRRWTWEQVYWNGFRHEQLVVDAQRFTGILHYVRMRHDSALAQLQRMRADHPRGSSGATFPPTIDALPESP